MQIETVAAAFAAYDQAVLIPAGLPAEGRKDARLVFYSGAKAMLDLIGSQITAEPEARRSSLRALWREMEAFARDLHEKNQKTEDQ